MSDKIIFDSGRGKTLQNILSIKVAVCSVTRVGLDIKGRKEADINNSIKS